MTDFKYRVFGDWKGSDKGQEEAKKKAKAAIKEISATARTEMSQLNKNTPTMKIGDIRSQLAQMSEMATVLGKVKSDLLQAQKAGVSGVSGKSGLLASINKDIAGLEKLETRLVNRARTLGEPIKASSPVAKGKVSDAVSRGEMDAMREIRSLARERSKPKPRSQEAKELAKTQAAEALVDDEKVAALRDRAVVAKERRKARDAAQKALARDPQEEAFINDQNARASAAAARAGAIFARDPERLGLQAEANVESRRTKARQAAADALYNRKDLGASSRESTDLGIAEAEKRRQAAQNLRAIEQKTIPFVKEIAENQAEAARLAGYRESYARKEAAASQYKGAFGRQALSLEAQAQVQEGRNKAALGAETARQRVADPLAASKQIQDEAFAEAQGVKDSTRRKLLKERELEGSAGTLAKEEAETAALTNRRNLLKRKAIANQETEADAILRAKTLVSEQNQAERRKLALLTQQVNQLQLGLGSGAGLAGASAKQYALAQQSVKVRQEILQQQLQLRKLEHQALKNALATGGVERGTRFQRLQARISERTGGEARLPEQYQKLSQFVGSKALTTFGFALSGAVLYGGINAMKQMVKEASQLQKELKIIESQFMAVGKSSQDFGRFKETIIDISLATGKAADELARVGRSLLGVFRTTTQDGVDLGPNQALAERELDVAAKFSVVTGVDMKQITDEMVALYKSFERFENISFKDLADSMISVENRSGVLSNELLDIAASLAPVAANLGISSDELIRYSAAATQGSGKNAAAISDGLNRFLTSLPEREAAIKQVYAADPNLGPGSESYGKLLKAFDAKDFSAVIRQLITDYNTVDPSLRGEFGKKVIGDRNAQAVIGLLQNKSLALDDTLEDPGALNQRFRQTVNTVEIAFKRAGAAVEKFGEALFDAGLGDALVNLAAAAFIAVSVLTKLTKFFVELDERMQGFGSTIIGAAIAAKLMGVIFKQVAALRGAQTATAAATAAASGTGNLVAARGTGGAVPLVGAAARGQRLRAALPSLGLTAAFAALSTYFDARNQSNTEVADFRDRLAGMSNAQIDYARQNIPNDGFGMQLQNFIYGRKSDEQLYGDEAQQRYGPARAKALSTLTDQDLSRTGNGLSAEQNRVLLDEAVAALTAGSTDNRYEKTFEAFKNLQGEIDSAVFDAALAQYDEDIATLGLAVEATTDTDGNGLTGLEEKQAKIEQMVSKINLGSGTLNDLRNAYAARREDLQAMVNAAKIQGVNYDKEQALLDQAIEDQNNTFDKLFQEATQRRTQLRTALGEDANLVKIQEAERTLSNVETSPEAKYAAAVDMISAQDALFDKMIEDAKSVQEIKDLYKQSLENFNPAAEESIIKGQLADPVNSDLLAQSNRNLALATPEDTTTAQAQVYSMIDEAGGVNEALLQAQARMADLQNQLVTAQPEVGADGQVYDPKPFIQQQIREQTALIALLDGLIDPTEFIEEYEKAKVRKGYEDIKKKRQRQANLDSLGTYDAATASNYDLEAAKDNYNEAIATGDDDLIQEALIEYEQAKREYWQVKDAEAKSFLDVESARAAGDPLEQARIAQRQADLAMQQARGDVAASNAATAARIQADQAMEDAQNDIQRARLELQAAEVAGDPVAAAQVGVELANQAVANAKGEAERLRALAAQIQAQRSLGEAIVQMMTGMYDVAIAVRNAAGDSVGAAQLELEKLTKALSEARRRGDKYGELQLLAQKIQAEAGVRDAKLADRTSDIDFALAMEQITTGQAIRQLELLLKIPDLTKQQIQDLQLKIKELRDGSGLSNGNIPSELNLPTIYEVERLQQLNGSTYQSARDGFLGTSSGASASVDNSVTTVNIYAKNTVEASAALQVVKETLESAPRSGVDYRLY